MASLGLVMSAVSVVRLGPSEKHSVAHGRGFLLVSLHVSQPFITGYILITRPEAGAGNPSGNQKTLVFPGAFIPNFNVWASFCKYKSKMHNESRVFVMFCSFLRRCRQAMIVNSVLNFQRSLSFLRPPHYARSRALTPTDRRETDGIIDVPKDTGRSRPS